MTTDPELARAVESLASTYGEAARLLVVAERERVLLRLEDYANMWFAEPTRAQFMAELRRIREGSP